MKVISPFADVYIIGRKRLFLRHFKDNFPNPTNLQKVLKTRSGLW